MMHEDVYPCYPTPLEMQCNYTKNVLSMYGDTHLGVHALQSPTNKAFFAILSFSLSPVIT